MSVQSSSPYVGRFAPSPSGPLHFGSLVSALGSFLQAKSNDGKWLLRIEDIDPPREVKGAADNIIECLKVHGLIWEEDVTFQSHRMQLYADKLTYLDEAGFVFNCCCTRAQLSLLKDGELCSCATQNLPAKNAAIRFIHKQPQTGFVDQLLGAIEFSANELPAHFTLKRKDGLIAYQLAVVVDDIEQGITEVARGADLLPATGFQLALYKALNHPIPKFLHFPVVVTEPGKKLSKQNHAKAIDFKLASENLWHALTFLGLCPDMALKFKPVDEIIDWGIKNWDLKKLVAKTERIDNRIARIDSI